MIAVDIGETDRLERALRGLRRLARSRPFADVRRNRFNEKPGVARKSDARAARRLGQR